MKHPAIKAVVQHGTQSLKSLLAVVNQELWTTPFDFSVALCRPSNPNLLDFAHV